MTTTMKTKETRVKKTVQYEPAALYRVYDKSGAVLGYAAPSRNGKEYYQVTCDQAGHWHCTCPATIICVHIRAVQELCAIRVASGRPGCKFASTGDRQAETRARLEREARLREMEMAAASNATPGTPERRRDTWQDLGARGSLSSNRGFSFLR